MSAPAKLREAAIAGVPGHANGAVLVSILDELRELRAAVEASLAQPQPSGLVDAGTVAAVLGVSRAWVYEHADELGGVRLGDGAKPRLRFDLNAARERMACSSSKRSQSDSPNSGGGPPRRSPRRASRLPLGVPKPGSILTIRPREAAKRGDGRLPSGADPRVSERSGGLGSRRGSE